VHNQYVVSGRDSTSIPASIILKTSILATVYKSSDLVLSHPPYHDMIPYIAARSGGGEGAASLSRAEEGYRLHSVVSTSVSRVVGRGIRIAEVFKK
jgi:hypothetical protein